MKQSFTESILVPVADQEDATKTAAGLDRYSVGDVTVLHVVEKGEGVLDKTPVEQSEMIAERAFDAFREEFPDANTEITYRRDVVEGIIDVAHEIDASAIAFRPRGGGRILQFIAGDRSLRLITEADLPVITIPEDGDE